MHGNPQTPKEKTGGTVYWTNSGDPGFPRGRAVTSHCDGEEILAAVPEEGGLRRDLLDDAIVEPIVIDVIPPRCFLLPIQKEERIERFPVEAGEVLLGRVVELLEVALSGPPFQVVPKLVGQRFPRLASPVESLLQ